MIVLPVTAIAGAAIIVLLTFVDVNNTQNQIELIKTGLTVGAGTGGIVALVLNGRRQWSTEHDATERRLTELYVKAIEQLGSENGVVRHGCLYGLERVAQDNPRQRQSVVDVICAYLRRPYTPPTVHRPLGKQRSRFRADHSRGGDSDVKSAVSSREEREIRLAAQRILGKHLSPGDFPDHPDQAFWVDIDLDLSGAILSDFSLKFSRVRSARFAGAKFIGDADFSRTVFMGVADFAGAEFVGSVRFDEAKFSQYAGFSGVGFGEYAWFEDAQFLFAATFDRSKFADFAGFAGAEFAGPTGFEEVHFGGNAVFQDSTFGGRVEFEASTLCGIASFEGVKFRADATFSGVRFVGLADFRESEWQGLVEFVEAGFLGVADFNKADFLADVKLGGVSFAEASAFSGASFFGSVECDDGSFEMSPLFVDADFYGATG
ncbi:pentapeptide repeat-containing protein [Amycolatopsis sp. Hca4]|uniref:pentapeptide repeat-containing protein n=1 Tax=Amycolatopsis sp. Hca4 TaxID=2742131 RepID=UPI0015915496|nr:pentapeptide repeat-containing protein [Amycolatopsis sp. Hca4]QKV79357.1 pentapeptide repeat-containing protein [Amycolatopsis sp. Hca4]